MAGLWSGFHSGCAGRRQIFFRFLLEAFGAALRAKIVSLIAVRNFSSGFLRIHHHPAHGIFVLRLSLQDLGGGPPPAFCELMADFLFPGRTLSQVRVDQFEQFVIHGFGFLFFFRFAEPLPRNGGDDSS